MLLLPMLLRGIAADWYISLTDKQKQDWKLFEGQFANRVFPSAVEKLKGMQVIWNMRQGQTVDEFLRYMQKQQRLYQNLSEKSLKTAIMLGLRSDIKKHVILANPQSIPELIQAAKIAEQAEKMTQSKESIDS